MSLLDSLLQRRRLVIACATLLALAGLLSWSTMPREEDPQFPKRNGLVLVNFPGADAETVERLVVEPLEEHLAEVEDLLRIDSTARAGFAIVSVEQHEHVYDTDDVWDDVQDAMDRAQVDFPSGVSEPLLDDDLVSQEAIVLAITGSADPLVLDRAAEKVKRVLLALDPVKQVTLVADPGEQITIEYDDAVARRLGVDAPLLGQQLSRRSQISPGGLVHVGAKTANLRPQTEFLSLEDIRSTPVVLPGGSSVPLRALARVRQGPREPAVEIMRWNGEPAVGLGVIPRDGLDRVSFGRVVRQSLENLAPEIEPLLLEEVVFQPDLVEQRLEELTGSLRLGILIVAGVLFVTMGLRLGALVAVVLPLVTFGSIALFATGGGILHQISIAALVIALGMLVDNAIVVVENIQWRLDRGLQVHQAATDAVRSLALPLGTATGTTLAAFVPMLVAKGGTADFTRSIPVLIMLTLSVSYLFAITVTPVLSQLVLKRRAVEGGQRLERLATRIGELAVGRAPWVLVAAALLLVLSLMLSGWVDQQFFPAADRSLMVVDLEMPEGTHIGETDRLASRLERELLARDEVRSVATFVGRAAPRFYYNLLSKPNSPHRAQLVTETTDLAAVSLVTDWVRRFVRKELPEVEVVARRLEQGPPIESPIEIRVLGNDLGDLEQVADQVLGELRQVDGTRDTRHDLGLGVPTVVFEIDDVAAARHGLSRRDVASALLGRTLGTEIGQFRMGEDPVPILVRSSVGEDYPVSDLASIDVVAPGGKPVPLAQLAKVNVGWRPAAIQHFQRSRLVKVQAQLAEGVTSARVLEELAPRIDALDLPAGIRLELGGELEESGKANAAIFRAMPLGLLLLLFFLLAEFNSFRRVGIVLVTVPLAAIGVVPGLLLSGQAFGFTAMLGVISLVGIVVNNAIVLLDVVESLRVEGFPLNEALVEAVRRRMRPILLTMTTTVMGLGPLAFSETTLWPPLAWAMISGLLASTFLTLVVIPALYKVLFTRPRWMRPARGGQSLSAVVVSLGLVLAFGAPAQGSAEAEGFFMLASDGAASSGVSSFERTSTVLTSTVLTSNEVTGSVEPNETPRLTIFEAVAQALDRPSSRAARSRALAAERRAEAERREAIYPEVDISYLYSSRDDTLQVSTPVGDFQLGERNSNSTTFTITQPLLDPAKLFYGTKAARREAAAVDFDHLRVRQQVAVLAADGYLKVLEVDAGRAATKAFIRSLAGQLEETTEQVERGRALEADALKVRLDLESAQLELLELEERRQVAVWDLGRAVGFDGAIEPEPIETLPDLTVLPQDELVRNAWSGRPDLAALQERKAGIDLRTGALRAERLPRLSARASFIRSDGDPFRPEEQVEGSLNLTWNPFSAGTRKPRLTALEAEKKALEADVQELERMIVQEVQRGLLQLRVAKATIEVRRRGVELAAETLRVEQERYRAGRSTTNDLLVAEASLRRQRTDSDLARIGVLRAWALLEVAAGRIPFGPSPAEPETSP